MVSSNGVGFVIDDRVERFRPFGGAMAKLSTHARSNESDNFRQAGQPAGDGTQKS